MKSTDTLGRSLRWAKPTGNAERLVLTDSDYLLFEAINRHGALPTRYLYEYRKELQRNYTFFQKRLAKFYNGDDGGPFLTRPVGQFNGFEARYQDVVYDLAPRAKAALAARGALGGHPVNRTNSFVHDLMNACVTASIELGCRTRGLRFIAREEILSHQRIGEAKGAPNLMALPLHSFAQDKLIPDDLFGIEYPEGIRFFAFEADRSTESIERKDLAQNAFGRKVAGYLQILTDKTYKTWWGIANLTVLTATTNATHAANVIDYIRKQADPKKAERFAFNVEPCFSSDDYWRVPKAVLAQFMDTPWTTPAGTRDISRV